MPKLIADLATHLVLCDDPFPGLVKQPLVVPAAVQILQTVSPVVVVAEPQNAEGQQEGVLVSSGIS